MPDSGVDSKDSDSLMRVEDVLREWGVDFEIDPAVIQIRRATRPSGAGAAPILLVDFSARQAFGRDLEALFSDVALEDGYEHPAEARLRDVLAAPESRSWIEQIVNGRSRCRRDLLIMLGRLPLAVVGEWGPLLARQTLESTDERMRYAAVRALEGWGGPTAIEVLGEHIHREGVEWLVDLARRVRRDLSGG